MGYHPPDEEECPEDEPELLFVVDPEPAAVP